MESWIKSCIPEYIFGFILNHTALILYFISIIGYNSACLRSQERIVRSRQDDVN